MNERLSRLNNLKTHKDIENQGEWFYPTDLDDLAFKIKRAGGTNKEYNKVLAKLMKPHAATFHKKNKSKQEEMDHLKIIGEAVIRSCLVDWKGFPEQPVEFSKEKALEELLKDDWYDLLNMIADFAAEPINFKGSEEVEELGNS